MSTDTSKTTETRRTINVRVDGDAVSEAEDRAPHFDPAIVTVLKNLRSCARGKALCTADAIVQLREAGRTSPETDLTGMLNRKEIRYWLKGAFFLLTDAGRARMPAEAV